MVLYSIGNNRIDMGVTETVADGHQPNTTNCNYLLKQFCVPIQ